MAACIAKLPGTSMELISMATASARSGAALLQESRTHNPRRGADGTQLTIPSETIGLSETGVDGLARTNLRFSSQGGP
jgi:hypothetical protein